MKCKLLFLSGMAVSMMAMSFFNIPQQMFQAGGGIMFPVEKKAQACVCECR